MQTPNEGIELLYTRECRNWQQTLINLRQALELEKISDEPKTVIIHRDGYKTHLVSFLR